MHWSRFIPRANELRLTRFYLGRLNCMQAVVKFNLIWMHSRSVILIKNKLYIRWSLIRAQAYMRFAHARFKETQPLHCFMQQRTPRKTQQSVCVGKTETLIVTDYVYSTWAFICALFKNWKDGKFVHYKRFCALRGVTCRWEDTPTPHGITPEDSPGGSFSKLCLKGKYELNLEF